MWNLRDNYVHPGMFLAYGSCNRYHFMPLWVHRSRFSDSFPACTTEYNRKLYIQASVEHFR